MLKCTFFLRTRGTKGSLGKGSEVMALIIQKFGGTSVADISRIRNITAIIAAERKKSNKVIVVVSAMAGVTNQLVALCNELSSLTDDHAIAEYDVALSSGEVVTSALVALSLQSIGVKARSLLGWQIPIITSHSHSKALVERIDEELLNSCLENDVVPVIAGFQGITSEDKVTTLGRGGSDTTATLIAAKMRAARCDIYTDVAGVFTADPRVVHKACHIETMSFEEAIELSSAGAKILHPRCVEIAMRYNVPIKVLSSFDETLQGTLITTKDKIMEQKQITAITSNKNLLSLDLELGSFSFNKICSAIAASNLHIELMVNTGADNKARLILQLADKSQLSALLEKLVQEQKVKNYNTDTNIAIVSVVGFGIKHNGFLLEKVINALELQDIKLDMIEISGIKLSLLIKDENTERVVKILHEMFFGAVAQQDRVSDS